MPTYSGAKTRIHKHFEVCKDSLSSALENFEDEIAKTNALYAYKEAVNGLWAERNSRERAYAIVVNRLRTMLLDMELETVTREKIEAIQSVVRQAAASARLADLEIRQFGIILERAGIGCLDAEEKR